MATPAKTVCIIGAGPSGLVAAKTLIHNHPQGTFHVTVFEKSHRIGGLWPVTKQDDGMVNPDMCTNQSRHTVSFSDLAWPSTAPAFPKAWEVGQYLQRYIKTYPGYEIRTDCTVVKTEFRGDRWTVQVRDKHSNNEPESLVFDHVIVATGFFGKPIVSQVLKEFPAPVWHSSKIRNVRNLLSNDDRITPRPGKNILVVGGQMSGVEVAASIALQLSSEASTPGAPDNNLVSSYTVTNIIQKPFWNMPSLLPSNPQIQDGVSEKKNNPSPSFLPLDLVTYNLEIRPAGPIANTSGHITPEAADMTHNFLYNFLGSDQSELGVPELAMTGSIRSEPPYVTFSDEYNEFVRSGNIKVVKGKLIESDGSDSVIVQNGDQKRTITDIAAIILATGFEASPSLDFLPDEILQTLQFDSSGDVFPLALNVNSVVSSKIPSLGFVGFYRSPYWGVMEMHARFLGKLWTGDEQAAKALAEDTTMDTMLKLRKDPPRAQFPMGDYAYLMDYFSRILNIRLWEPEDSHAERTGLVFPARYTYDNASAAQKSETKSALDLFYGTFKASEEGKFLARAVFKAMQGDWKLNRVIDSFIESYPSGKLEGTAQFLPRFPTAEGFDKEYLYLEKGEFTSKAGLKFTAKRSYVYRYCEATDKLTVWFTKDDHRTVDYFFHEVAFLPKSETSNDSGWLAKADHWCPPDQYDVDYYFKFRGVQMEEWSPKYKVKGPNKDYTIHSIFTR